MANNILYPTIGGQPGSVPVKKERDQAPEIKIRDGESNTLSQSSDLNANESFEQVLGNRLSEAVRSPLKFSAHANARVQSRGLDIGPEQMRKLNEAVDKAAAKGLDDTLILTSDAAFIVNVKNRTVVTAMDKSSMNGNVFTNIDGAVIV